MKTRSFVLILFCLLALLAVWLGWPRAGGLPGAGAGKKSGALAALAVKTNAVVIENQGKLSAAATNRLNFRLSNAPEAQTLKGYGKLSHAAHAILLENAAVDTERKLDLPIPKHLQAEGDPGAYVVQARGRVDAAFHALLLAAGAKEVSYIPNNAWLVRLTSGAANALAGNPSVQAVLPYEPYYKVQSSLLGLAVDEKKLPFGQVLTLGLFADSADATVAQIEKLGGTVVARDRSPFGPIVRVNPPADWLALAQLPGVMRLEPSHQRKLANDLSRATMGQSTDSVTTTNYLNLSGSNVLVEVNDTGIDPNHPDLTGRVFFSFADSGLDIDGHGTFVAGVLAGNGSKSTTVTNASGSIMPGTNLQFRGKAPLANLFSVGFLGANDTNVFVDDSYLQEAPAKTNALISNNSWVNDQALQYDLSAASYDAAVRDALPRVTGPQPVLFVFAAGNDGGGDTGGQNGNADSISSPGTAKDVITVGALEQFRDITNTFVDIFGNTNAVWADESDSSSQVADYSSRGNVGIQTEGPYGRFKPDVVAPGSWVVSTRSTTWDTNAYYNVTNNHAQFYAGVTVTTNALAYPPILTIPGNAIGVVISITTNANSPQPFPNFPIYVSASGPPSPTTYDILVNTTNTVSIPPTSGGAISGLGSILNNQIEIAIGDGTNIPASFDLTTEIITTNDLGNELAVLQGLNDSLGTPPQYYRYESGTSVATPAVSGTLALIQDFFTNTLKILPSPALMKAMLINGARPLGSYTYAVTNAINLEGWGLPFISNSIPLALTNAASATNNLPIYFVDQSPTNSLKTGDSRTYLVTVPDDIARSQMLRVTLAWTDPPGNPAAAIKLVNNLDLVVTNLDTGDVFYGNNFSGTANPPNSVAVDTNNYIGPDIVNNVENIYLAPALGTNYSITVIGTAVNVNAITLDQTNVVQDFALVVSCGDGDNLNGITFTPAAPSYAQTTVPTINYLPATNGILFNQSAGANAPLLSTDGILIAATNGFAPNATLYAGVTNQWHFYVVTNTLAATNSAFKYAAFATFSANTLAIPREGGYVTTAQNPTRPQPFGADVELFVATSTNALAAQLLNINSSVISNCLNFVGDDKCSIGRGGDEFVTYTNSTGNQLYYVAVLCNDQMAAQFGFAAIFSDTPFSTLNPDGSQNVFFKTAPAIIPDGSNVHPGVSTMLGFAETAMTVRRVTATNVVTHQNFGDLVGYVSADGFYSILNNHDGFHNVVQTNLVYDDSGEGGTNGIRHTDAPGTLKNFALQPARTVWIFNEVDDSITQTGRVDNFSLRIYPHYPNSGGFVTNTIEPNSWFYDYVTVPAGFTNLLVLATNLPPNSNPYIGMYLNYQQPPDFNNYLEMTLLANGNPPGGEISYGPPLPPGTYWIGFFNPDSVAHQVMYGTFLTGSGAETKVDYFSTGPVPLIDDAVTYDSILVTNTLAVQDFNVGLRVDHLRISDLVFTLISPDGSRYLLMENRGNTTTNGCGQTVVSTNYINVNASGGPQAQTNSFDTGVIAGSLPLSYDMYTVPDQMTIYYGPSNNLSAANLITNFFVSGPGNLTVTYPPTGATITSTYLTIVMNATNHPARTRWTYNLGGIVTNNYYLAFTEDTDLTTTPIKFAPLPYVPFVGPTLVWADSFELYAQGTYSNSFGVSPTNWTVLSNSVSIVTNPPAYDGTNLLALGIGAVSNTLPTIAGQKYLLQYALGQYPFNGLFVANNNNGNGGFISTVSLNGQSSIFANGIPDNPYAMAIDTNANIYVSDLTTQFIYKFDQSGNSSLFIDGTGTSPALNYPDGLAFDSNGNLYVLDGEGGDAGNGSITSFSPTGVQTTYYTTNKLNFPSACAMDTNNNLYVANINDNTIYKFSPPNTNGVFFALADNQPSALAIDAVGNVYVANLGDNDIQRFSPAGTSLGIFASGLNMPSALAFDNTGNLYCANQGDNTIVEIAAGGGQSIFATNNVAFPQGLVFYSSTADAGSGATWSQQAVSFTATQSGSPLVLNPQGASYLDSATNLLANITGNNLFFDAFKLTHVPTDLFYQAEQDLSPIKDASAYGLWQMEVLDNRMGAASTNNSLVSWRLEFVFANTNISLPILNLTNGIAVSNTVPGGFTEWYQVNVPTNADYATNILFSASPALNVWFSTNTPPTTTNAGDVLLLSNSTGGTNLLGTNGSPVNVNPPAYLQPGGTYYIGFQNTNVPPASFAVQVNFHLIPTNITSAPVVFTEAATAMTGTNASLNGFVVANGSPTLAWFEYGTNMLYGKTTPPISVGSTSNLFYAAATVLNLTYGAPYHFRIVASNAVGTVRGYDHMFGVGGVVAWGDNTYGQTSVPAGLANVVAVACDDSASIALKTDGTIAAWGGVNGETSVPAGATNVVAIAAAAGNCLALRADGAVFAWGQNNLLTAGLPVVASQLTNVVALAVGYQTGIALRNDGSVVSWGRTPVTLAATNQIAVVASGYNWSAPNAGNSDEALTASGVQFAFFDNNTPASFNWTGVVALSGYSGLYTNGYRAGHTLALKSNGTLLDPPTYVTYGSALVPAGNNFETVSAGANHGLALTFAGGVVAWGDNALGQTNVPAVLTNATAIAAGAQHNLAVQFVSSAPPTVITLAATNIITTNATLQASVNPNGAATTVFYNYGTTTNYGSVSTTFVLTNNLSSFQPIALVISNLQLATVYHFQAVGTNLGGVSYGGDIAFTSAPAAPYAFTAPARAVTGTSVSLNGFATANGLPASAWFEWGLNSSYGSRSLPASVGNGIGVTYLTNQVIGLTNGLPYHAHLVVSNALGVTYGYDQVFGPGNVVAWGNGQNLVPPGLTNAISVAAGFSHSLALKTDGTVLAWGDNTYGQTNVPSGLNSVIAIAGGYQHSLALKSNGTVVGWGDNTFGQTSVPVSLSNVVAIVGGGSNSVALKSDGTVVAWGNNSRGQANVPAGLSNVVAIASGSFFNAALKNDGTVLAWGDNTWGQTNIPVGLNHVVALAGGDYQLLALKDDGNLVAWGDNFYGEASVPANVSNVLAVATGDAHDVVIKTDGTPIIWGDNLFGEQNIPAGLNNLVAVTCSVYHSLVIQAQVTTPPISPSYATTLPATFVTGTAAQLSAFVAPNGVNSSVWFEWGTNLSYGNFSTPISVGAGSNVVYVTNNLSGLTYGLPYRYRVAVSNSVGVTYGYDKMFGVGSVIAWGDGALGDTNVPSNLTNVVAVAAGQSVSVALKTDGTVVAWGSNLNGESTVPGGLNNVVAIAAANAFGLALKGDGTVTGWGSLGASARYAYYAGLSNIVAISMGSYDNAVALTKDGRVLSYDSTLTNSPVIYSNTAMITSGYYFNEGVASGGTIFQFPSYPSTVPPAWTNIVGLSMAFNNHLIGLKGDGSILDWTNFSFSSYTYTPPAGTNYELVAAGGAHGLALKQDGTLVAWGDNSQNQIAIPAGLSNNIIAIAAGNSHSLAVRTYLPVAANTVAPVANNFGFTITRTNLAGKNAYRLAWSAPTNYYFKVQWKPLLTGTNWNTFTNPAYVSYAQFIKPASSLFAFIDDGSQTAGLGATRFYRLLLAATNAPTAIVGPVISSVSVNGGRTSLRWNGLVSSQYQVRWATNLVSPINWAVFNTTVTSTNGVFNFTDTNAALKMKFYQLIQTQ